MFQAAVGRCRIDFVSMRKPVPPRDFAKISPPNREHEYFEDCAEHPFLPSADEFEFVNAWWMAEAALLAYANPSFAEKRLLEAGLHEFRHFDGESTQCYVAHGASEEVSGGSEFVIVAFSGSDMRQREGNGAFDVLADWLVNLNFGKTASERNGKVHQGFKQALDEVWDPPDREGSDSLKKYLDDVCDGGRRKVWITGHSLGGALAALAASRHEPTSGLYTFGAPRIGDRSFVKEFGVPAYRFVNCEDVVTGFPLRGQYRHVGENRIIDANGQIHVARAGWSGLRESAERAYMALRYPRSGPREKLARDLLMDHAPILYAIHIGNACIEEKRLSCK